MNRKFQFPFLYPQTIFKLTKLFKDEKISQKVLTEFQVSSSLYFSLRLNNVFQLLE